MVKSETLLREASRDGIDLYTVPLPACGACSVLLPDGSCAIGIDTAPAPDALRRVQLAHELGHCKRGAFYNLYSPFDIRSRHERRADEWAIRRLVPLSALKKAAKRGIIEAWEIAEEFGVTVQFAQKAIDYYRECENEKSE